MGVRNSETKVKLRPHAKAHKSPVIAREQMALGAVGVCCQKVDEAEEMVRGGKETILGMHRDPHFGPLLMFGLGGIFAEVLKADYAKSPSWLKALMDAWADGLNYYLYTHPRVKPRVMRTGRN